MLLDLSSDRHLLAPEDFREEDANVSNNDRRGMPGGEADSLVSERQLVEKLAERETRKVQFWRRKVLMVMALTGAFGTAMAYVFLKRVDQRDFESSFEQVSQSIRDSTEFNLRGLIEATNGMAQIFTSQAIKTNSQWPFMTLSSFEVFVRNSNARGSSELLVIASLVNATAIPSWNEYANEHQGWIDESYEEYDTGRTDHNPIPSSIYRFGRFKGKMVLKPEDGWGEYPAAPFWQMSPPPYDTSIINFNALSVETYQRMYDAMIETNHWVMGIAGPNELIDFTMSQEQHDELHSASEINANSSGFANDHPHTAILYPVYQGKDSNHPSGSDINSPIVALILNKIPWDKYLQRLLPNGVNGIDCVLHNSAGQAFTYHLRGPDALYLGADDLHEREFDQYKVQIDFEEFLGGVFTDDGNPGNQRYWFSVYPSKEFQDTYETNTPITFAIVFAVIYLVMVITFVLYDRFVTHKNNIILDAATHSNAILASLFPKHVKARLLEDKAEEGRAMENKHRQKKKGNLSFSSLLDDLLNYASDGEEEDDKAEILKSKPIADVFEEATVLFADLVGFTAWSSTREPTEVFILLETLYRNFDMIAKRRDVYKVETIGDCYVAVTGCPTPRIDHHVAMCRFAIECMKKMKELCQKLESELGPDTSTLNMRFGMHSGPVTGGVLRGERSRFQLFGDTMNTAARMESNGKPGSVHLSEATAKLLILSGKEHWVVEREDKITAKGKGQMTTYWLGKTISGRDSVVGCLANEAWTEISSETGAEDRDNLVVTEINSVLHHLNPSTRRVVDWTSNSLMTILERLASQRTTYGLRYTDGKSSLLATPERPFETPLDELQEAISFHLNPVEKENTSKIVLGQQVEDQLLVFVGTIASLYNSNNSFHCFDHASHVLQSVLKFFSRMSSKNSDLKRFSGLHANGEVTRQSLVVPKGSSEAMEGSNQQDPTSSLDISKDPMAVFACAFAALVHDVEHPGVPNARLKVENPSLASTYKRSIAEQHSFTTAWNLLREERFDDLRLTICPNEVEAARFRQLVINTIIATDLFDKRLSESRKSSWARAFESGRSSKEEDSPKLKLDRQATLVLEHVIQASDLSHMLQHWHIYRQWNTKLYQEMFQAFSDGRAEKDPSIGWFQGEIDFFDRHVIPLAKRLNDLGCFGSFGEECLENAKRNRLEWEQKGIGIVNEMRTAEGRELLSDPEETIDQELQELHNVVSLEVTDLDNLEEDFKADLEDITKALDVDELLSTLDRTGDCRGFQHTKQGHHSASCLSWEDSMDFSC